MMMQTTIYKSNFNGFPDNCLGVVHIWAESIWQFEVKLRSKLLFYKWADNVCMHAQAHTQFSNGCSHKLKSILSVKWWRRIQYTHTRTQRTYFVSFRFVYSLAHPKFRIYIIYSLRINDVRQFTNTDDLADTQTNARTHTHKHASLLCRYKFINRTYSPFKQQQETHSSDKNTLGPLNLIKSVTMEQWQLPSSPPLPLLLLLLMPIWLLDKFSIFSKLINLNIIGLNCELVRIDQTVLSHASENKISHALIQWVA